MKNPLLPKCKSLFAIQCNKKNTTRFNGLLALFLMVMGIGVSWGQVNFISGTYTQNFDGLAATNAASNTWLNNSTITGWYLFNSASNAITSYGAETGLTSNSTFNSYGASSGATERALGSAGSGGTYWGSPASGNIAGWSAIQITNGSGGTLNSITIGFDGEQWRNGGNTSTQSMVLEYGFGSTFASVSSWIAPSGNFDWTSPVATGTAAAVIGNVAGLASSRGGTIAGLTWTTSQTLWIRWVERNDTGNDHGLAIDNFTFTSAATAAPTYTVTFDNNGGTGTMANQTANTSTNLTTNSFTRTGYTFSNWNTSANGSGTAYANNASYSFTSNATLFAQWTANTLAVTYNSQSGSAISNGSTTTGGSIANSPGTPTRSGYVFNGWFAASSGGTAITFPYTHGQTSDFTLFAQWQIPTWDGTAWSNTSGPTTSLNAIINGNLITSTDLICKDLTINSGTTLTIGAGKKLTVSGNLINNGTIVFKSDATNTAMFDVFNGTQSGTGVVTVERYIPAKRAWRALTAPVSTTGSIFANWQEGGTGNGVNGFDIWMPAGTNGLTAGGSSNSLLEYNSASNTWTGITATNGSSSMMNSTKNKPFMAFVTGPYGSGNITSNFAETTLRATGSLLSGDQSYTTTAGKYTFIGNPYASPLDLSVMMNNTQNATASFEGNVWVWDANASGLNAVGTYNLFNNGTYTNLTSNTAVVTGTQIQSGQAFFVKSTDGATFTIKESHKRTTFSNAVFRNNNPAQLLRVGLYKQVNNEWSGRDGAMTVILADAEANQASNKMANGTENIAFVKNGSLFASNHHLPLVASDVLNIRVWRTTAGANYKLKINTEQFASTNLNATLEDLFTNSRTPLNLEGSAVEYPFTVTNDALSTGDRFRIVFQNAVLGTNNPTATSFSIVPNPVIGESFQVNLGTLATGKYSYSICNAIGQEVENGILNNVTQNTNYEVKMSNSATGIYIMKIKGNDNTVFTAKIIKK